jgi:hypothetical protein
MGLIVILVDLENRKISFSSPWIKLIPQLPSPYPGSYTECAIQAPVEILHRTDIWVGRMKFVVSYL